MPDGRETTVSIRQLAPAGEKADMNIEQNTLYRPNTSREQFETQEETATTEQNEEQAGGNKRQETSIQEEMELSLEEDQDSTSQDTTSESEDEDRVLLPRELLDFNKPGVQERNNEKMSQRTLRNKKTY